MKYRKLGRYGARVSEIGIGGWINFGSRVENEASVKILETAVDEGVNFIDVADVYAKGGAERVVGMFLEGRERSDLVLSSKVFGRMSENPNNFGLSTKHIHG